MKRKEHTAAHRALDEATSELIDKAESWPTSSRSGRVCALLRAAREYARALNRVETMRVKR